jgi:hypothetical protein
MGWGQFPSLGNQIAFFDNPPPMADHVCSMGLLTSSFWLMQNIAQRSFSAIGFHAGRGGMLFSTSVGFLSTTICMGLSLYGERLLKPHVTQWISSQNYLKIRMPYAPIRKYTKNDYIKRLLLGVSVFALLEQGAFHTAFPSSVIQMGVFANSWRSRSRSVLSTSDVATPAQRAQIQELGKRFGCHQCGSNQIFSKETFIADHMPPTKFAKEANARWWRKILRMPVRRIHTCFELLMIDRIAKCTAAVSSC